jgi:nicotinamidase/pyrazinamidase
MDFMSPGGALYVPGAERIGPQLARLAEYARQHNIPWISSADAHAPEDPSFGEWTPHCVVGTPGQRRVPETTFAGAAVIPNRPGAFHPPFDWTRHLALEVEKQEYSVATNANFDVLLAALGPSRFVVFGVATDYCVKESALALRRLQVPVDLVVDAIREIDPEGGRRAIEEMTAAGVRLVTTEEVCSGALEPATVAP